jgi:hypothetical protein
VDDPCCEERGEDRPGLFETIHQRKSARRVGKLRSISLLFWTPHLIAVFEKGALAMACLQRSPTIDYTKPGGISGVPLIHSKYRQNENGKGGGAVISLSIHRCPVIMQSCLNRHCHQRDDGSAFVGSCGTL